MLEVGNKFSFYGKILQRNNSTYDTYPVNVETEKQENVIVRIPEDLEISINKIYFFETETIQFKDKVHYLAKSVKLLGEMNENDARKEELLKLFYHYAPVEIEKIKKDIEETINSIKNKVLKDITQDIYNEHKEDFYLYPAATKFHHAYISGLAYHTHSMLRLAKGFFDVYPFLNEDLVNAGIVLHDICKIFEFDSYEGSEYTIKGKLIGHITMGASLIDQVATKLGYQDEEETMLLQHIIISHHYYGNFGSPRKPNIAEALIIHFIDNIDSKTTVLGEELNIVETGHLTSSIGVLERERYYKHKLTNE
ncbi:HD domain-containing protein [Candidatus Izemoplasma sp. B36]|uniref:HD domain-containing protein n=1 Tax=Candidatus Izemoplasma sp. B36 TaxID=3242468 RepID=UPI0035584665